MCAAVAAGTLRPMPYILCPNCLSTSYSAARFTTLDDCPYCGEPLDRRPQDDEDGRVSAFTKSSSWPVVQHSKASQWRS